VREGQVFRRREGGAGGQQAQHRRIVGAVDEQHRALGRAAGLELIDEETDLAVGHADRSEDHGERLRLLPFAPQHPRLGRDLGGQLVGRQPRPGEDGQLLPARQRVQAIDGRDAGLDELAGMGADGRVDRRAVDVQRRFRYDQRPAVNRLAGAVQHPAEHRQGDIQAGDIATKTDARRAQVQPGRPHEHLDDAVMAVDFQHTAQPHPAFRIDDLHHLMVGNGRRALDEDQRPPDLGDRAVLLGDQSRRRQFGLHRNRRRRPPAKAGGGMRHSSFLTEHHCAEIQARSGRSASAGSR